MKKYKNLLNNKQLSQYLDQEVPLQQLEDDKSHDLPNFMQAQLTYTKSKHSKQSKVKQRVYKKISYKKGGTNE